MDGVVEMPGRQPPFLPFHRQLAIPNACRREAIVYDRRTFWPLISSVKFRYCPGRNSKGRRGPAPVARRKVRTSGVSSNTWATRSCPAHGLDRVGAAAGGAGPKLPSVRS